MPLFAQRDKIIFPTLEEAPLCMIAPFYIPCILNLSFTNSNAYKADIGLVIAPAKYLNSIFLFIGIIFYKGAMQYYPQLPDPSF